MATADDVTNVRRTLDWVRTSRCMVWKQYEDFFEENNKLATGINTRIQVNTIVHCAFTCDRQK